MRVVRLPSGALLFDDSYNANPASMANAPPTALHEVATRENRRSHRPSSARCASSARARRASTPRWASWSPTLPSRSLVCVGASVGGETSHALASAKARGIETLAAADAEEAASLVVPLVRAGDLVLVKGSRGVATDRVVCALEVAS